MSKKTTLGGTEVTIYDGGLEKGLEEMKSETLAQQKADAQTRFDAAMTKPKGDPSEEIEAWWAELAAGLIDPEAFGNAMRERHGAESQLPLVFMARRLIDFIEVKKQLAKAGLTYGVDYSIYGGSGKDLYLVCSPIKFIAEARDAANGGWCIVVEVQDGDGKWHRLSIPRSDLAKHGAPWLQSLMDRRFDVFDLREFMNAFPFIKVNARERIVTKTGWYGNTFVLPDEVIGAASGEAISFQGEEKHRLYQSGTLEVWQKEVAGLCLGNSRLEFAVSAGFAAPLLTLINMDGGGFNFFGESSVGKTMALRSSGSVWGGTPTKPYHRTFDNTEFAFEKLAEAHNDLPFCIDEGKQAAAKVLAKILYKIADGHGKGRVWRDNLGETGGGDLNGMRRPVARSRSSRFVPQTSHF